MQQFYLSTTPGVLILQKRRNVAFPLLIKFHDKILITKEKTSQNKKLKNFLTPMPTKLT